MRKNDHRRHDRGTRDKILVATLLVAACGASPTPCEELMSTARQAVVEYRDTNRGFTLDEIQNQTGDAGVALVEFRNSMAEIGAMAVVEGCAAPENVEEFSES